MTTKLDGKQQDGEAHTVSFRADKEAMEAIKELAAAVGPGVVGRRSVAIRRALLEARTRLRASARKRL